ncbi:MAG: Hsp20/alpha crystallin family protein, partial [Bacteroidota bacterium]
MGGTATPGADYTYSITASGVNIITTEDSAYEPDETIVVTLTSAGGNGILGQQVSHTISLTEPSLSIEFSTAQGTVTEGGSTSGSFTLPLPAGVVPDITIGGSATQTTDFTYQINSNGITITTINDGTYDPGETVVITINGFSGNVKVGTVTSYTLTINEPIVTVEFAASASILNEGTGNSIVFVNTLPSGLLPTVTFGGTATPGTDFTYEVKSNGVIISALADGLYDPNENILITLTAAGGNAVLGQVKTHSVSISEDPLTIGFSASTSKIGESNSGSIAYTIPLPAGVQTIVTVGGTATNGVDYSYSLTPAGVVITTTGDGIYDPDETIVLTITGVSGNAIPGTILTHTVKITEPQLVVEFKAGAVTSFEGSSGKIEFNISLPAEVVPDLTL